MKRRSWIKGILSAFGAAVTGVRAAGKPIQVIDLDAIIEAHTLVPNPMYGMTTFLKSRVNNAGGSGGVFEAPITEHPNWEFLRDKYGAFINDEGRHEFPPLIPEYRTGEPEPAFVAEDDPEEGWWKASEEWDAERDRDA